MGAASQLHKAGVFENPDSKKPEVPRMAGSIETKAPSEGRDYRSVGDFRDFR